MKFVSLSKLLLQLYCCFNSAKLVQGNHDAGTNTPRVIRFGAVN